MEPITVHAATIADLTYIDSLQRANAEQLAFYPACVFEREIPNSRVVLAKINDEPAGYLYHGALGPRLKIHQACIQYDVRGYLYGAALVNWLIRMADAAHVASITLRCGSDIDANGFWRAMGFYCQSVTKGGVRRMRDINEWRRDLAPQLFVTQTQFSEKSQDASLWRHHKSGTNSQFMRGAAMREYREQLERADLVEAKE